MVGYIYLNTDLKTGKQYTGQHHYNKEGELDPNYHGSGVLWTKVLKKRPKELIKEEYIKTCYSEEEMNSDEQYYIKLFKTLYPNGYNLTEGGDGCVASEETRKKMSQNHYDCSGEKHPMFGKKHSEETKKKLSDSHKGKPSPNKGKPMSEEQKKKLSESKKNISDETRKKMRDSHKGKPAPNKGKPMSEEQKKKLSKIVLQFTLDDEFVREWPSTNECGRNGFDRCLVSACCRGKRKTHKGFKWCYA